MPRLIDADWVLGHLKPYEPSDEEWGVTGGTALRLIHNAVDNAPTVDAVPVVRCDDCWMYEEGFCFSRHVGCGSVTPQRNPDDFCSHGKRKEGADNEP